MNKQIRLFLLLFLLVGAIFITGTLIINNIIKSKVEAFVNTRLPETIKPAYESINLDVFAGTITLNNASVQISNKVDSVVHSTVFVEKFIIEDVSYWEYLIKNQIHIEDIKLKSPTIKYYKDRVKPSKDSVRSKPVKLYKPILVDELSIDNTNLIIFDSAKDSVALNATNLTIEIDDIFIDAATLENRIPLTYKNYTAKADSIFLKVGSYENLTINDFKLKNKRAEISGAHLYTKYSKRKLSELIKKERDHFNVLFEKITIDDIDFGFKNRKFFGEAQLVTVSNADATLFRDKLIADDFTIKPLYSKMLRELPINLTIPTFKIVNSSIVYTEKVKSENTGGTIQFTNLYATITNVSNTNTATVNTDIDIKATFMETTPVNVQWQFAVQNTSDQFMFKSQIGALATERLNQFTGPNLHVLLEGKTTKTFFTVNGNSATSKVDFKIDYSDFKIEILDKEGKKKNKLLSAIANIFIATNSKKDGDNYREASGDVTRDQTKSFFNFLWLNVKEGLLKSLTGSNKKN